MQSIAQSVLNMWTIPRTEARSRTVTIAPHPTPHRLRNSTLTLGVTRCFGDTFHLLELCSGFDLRPPGAKMSGCKRPSRVETWRWRMMVADRRQSGRRTSGLLSKSLLPTLKTTVEIALTGSSVPRGAYAHLFRTKSLFFVPSSMLRSRGCLKGTSRWEGLSWD